VSGHLGWGRRKGLLMGGGFSFVWPGWVEMNFRVRFFVFFL
jgi:hypothetical protein